MTNVKYLMSNKNGPAGRRAGFTLVELMVVMTIMMVLTAIGVVSFQASTSKSRDGRRAADLDKIRFALEMYRQDVGGPYPLEAGVMSTLVPKYLQSEPTDPKTKLSYPYKPSGYTYSLFAYMENAGSATAVSQTVYCGGVVCNYEVKNP